GAHAARVRRVCAQGEPADPVRLGRQRQPAPPDDGAPEGSRRLQGGPRALQGRGAGDDRDGCGRGPGQEGGDVHRGADQGGEAARYRLHRATALEGAPRRAHGRRVLSRLRDGSVVRPVCAGGDAFARDHPIARGDGQDIDAARREGEARERGRRRAVGHHARGIQRRGAGRVRHLRQARERSRREDRLTRRQVMKSYWLKPDSGKTALEFRDVPEPAPGPGQILLKMHAAGMNRGELIVGHAVKAGGPAKAAGGEGAGEIAKVGEGGTGFKAGDRVMGRCSGAFAEYSLMDAREALAMPKNLSWEEAASIPLVFMVVHDMLIAQGRLKEGEWLLVTGISSGVGVAALQTAKALGAK